MGEGLVRVGDLYFGKLDAYSEVLEYGADIYQSLFYACPSFHVDKFLDGKAYYIHGAKGVGKTALLKHIEITATQKGSLVEFIRFKKDVDEEERNSLKRAGISNNSFEEIIEKEIPNDVGISCVYAWQVYIIKCIINCTNSSKRKLFSEDDNWKKLQKLIKGAYKNEESPIKRILPKMKRGAIKLDLDVLEIDADFEWENSEEKTVSFSVYAKKVIELFGKLKRIDNFSCGYGYILFDELELVHLKKKAYLRDMALIRDLILAINYINEISKRSLLGFFCIACFRTEVYRSVVAIGFELNKLVQDYGVEISWQQNGGAIIEHPLIKMLINRLINSQPEENRDIAPADIWSAYFEEYININYQNQSSMNYVIDQTWGKPRDLIRLFNLIQKDFEDAATIETRCFERVRKTYSQESWEEFSHELSAIYTQQEIDGIKQVLIGIGAIFSFKRFCDALAEKIHFESVAALNERHSPIEILKDLYRVGVIGTEREKWKRFYFKGDEDFDSTAECVIHYPLRRFFSV